ncbi:MAG: 30S ribosomal protein S20 [Proteobacteria bacterium]|nr:30S ribosomal protein S20 [Pseudomonadota bacterium]
MAHSKQAKKRIVQADTRRDANKQFKTKVRTYIKNVDKALEEGDKEAIAANFKLAMSGLHRAVSKKIFKKAYAARNISRMAQSIRKANEKADS